MTKIPILMYHDIRDEVYGKQKWFCVTPQQIQKDMELVSRNFSTISLHELKSWANKEASLPENPIIITFDDGYYSFYEHAFPVLERLGMKATVSLVGSQIGKKCYKDSDIHLIKRIGYEEARSMFSSGLVDFQSHSYDMHDNKDVEADGRTGSLIKEGESEEEYEKALIRDYENVKGAIESGIGGKVIAHFYPLSVYDELSERILKKAGCEMTIIGHRDECNDIRMDPSSLYGLTRANITKPITNENKWKLLL